MSAEANQQFLMGMKNIQDEIIKQVRATGAQVSAESFRWNMGQKLVPPPEAVTVEVKLLGRTFNAVFPREFVDDSCGRIERHEVTSMVDLIVSDLTKP